MSQIFHRHTNIYSRLSILALVGFVATLGAVVAMLHLSGYNTNQGMYVEQHMRQKKRLDLEVDPPPDLAVEVDVSRSVIKRMKIYAALKVPEVWRFKSDQLRAYLLQADGSYKISEQSSVLPFLATTELQPWIEKAATVDQSALGREFMAWVEKELKPRLNGGRKNGKRTK